MIKSFSRLAGATALVGLLFTPALVTQAFGQTMQMDTTNMPMQEHAGEESGMMGMGGMVTFGDLELSGYFTRAMPPRAVAGGGFVTIMNNGDADDRLLSASSSVSEHVELHIMSMDGDVMKMQSQPDGFVIAAGEKVELKPGGKHIMFIGVETPFAEGENVKVMLHFEHAGMVELMLHAIPIGAAGMEHGSMDHGSMDHSTMEIQTSSD